jgi:N-acetylneuraminate synthase
MEINGRPINSKNKPYIIAELSANHGGSIERAKKSILQALKHGADAVKIQTYTADTMTIDCPEKADFRIEEGLWSGSSLYDLYQSAHTPFEWHGELFEYARALGITLFSTPFDETAVDLLESVKTPAYKIASFELTDLPLIEYIAKKQKPILLSTGMGTLEEIAAAIGVIKDCGQNEFLLFHCISSYPTPLEESNLSNIQALRKKFHCLVGLSDHSLTNLAATVAIGCGAVAIEKHFKLDDENCGPDSSFSIKPDQLQELVINCSDAWKAKGKKGFFRAEVETKNQVFRRSLYFIKDVEKGQPIRESDIRRIRPGFGLAPKHLAHILGKRIVKSVERGDPVTWDCVKNEDQLAS